MSIKTSLYKKGEISLSIHQGKYNTFFHPPGQLRVLRREGGFAAYPTDLGGGLRGGDQLRTHVEMASDTSLSWLPPASTLCYPGLDGESAVDLDTSIQISDKANLFWVEPAFIPCSGSRINRKVKINIDSTSRLFYYDIFSPGRSGFGEEWQFQEYFYDFSFFINSKPMLFERYSLSKGNFPLGRAGFQEAKLWASVIIKGNDYLAFLEGFLSIFGDEVVWFKGELGFELWNIKILDYTGRSLSKLPVRKV